MKKIKILLLFFLLFLIGCSRENKISLPDCEIPSEHLNKEITIQPYYSINTLKQGDGYHFFVVLNSDIRLISSNDFNERIFLFDDNEQIWKEIDDLAIYIGDGIELSSEAPQVLMVIQPSTANAQKRARYYVCVSGEIVDNQQQVAGASYSFSLSK